MPKGPITWTDDDCMAEIERLRKEREDFRQGFIKAGCEAERLRNALESIAGGCGGYSKAQHIAREALREGE